jgi:vancomycin resistance protein YoaR
MMNEKQKMHDSMPVFFKLLLAVPITLVIFLVVVVASLLGFERVYADRVYPGVHVYDIDLSGMTRDETDQALAEVLQYAYEGQLQFTYEDQVWAVNPVDLGYSFDPDTSSEQAFAVGRGNRFPSNLIEQARAWFTGVQLSPVARYDERVALNYLQSIASEIDQPVIEASLGLENTEIVVISGQVGRTVDISAVLTVLAPHFLQMQDAVIPLPVLETSPVIMDVAPQAALARKILSEPLVLTAPAVDSEEDLSWSISPQDLAAMLIIYRAEVDEGENLAYRIGINENLFNVYLSSLAPGLSVNPVNARFLFNDDTGQLELKEPAVIGRNLDIDGSIEHIKTELIDGAHEIPLVFTTRTPAVTDDVTGEELGIVELAHQETTYFHGSGPSRVQNIRAASARFHGLLIAPWETFSMAQALGNISLDSGYAEAPIIYGGQTIQGVGGGVCQVSTTLFRAAFFAGYPIVERHAHSYRVGYYEQRSNGSRDPRLAGLDAAVYVPIVDLKFTNDTDHWILMETYASNTSLTWRFYSTDIGRTVSWQTTGPTNVIEAPEPLYRENPDLPKGTIKQVDYAADGADVNVTRTVYINDLVHFSDSFFTRFQAWQAIYEYGPGTEGIPEPGSD